MTATLAPGPKLNVLLNPAQPVRNNTHLYLQRLEEQYGNIARVKFGPFTVNMLNHPDYIEHMFNHRDTYTKVKEGGMLRILLGNGLLTSDGEYWQKQRRLIQPVFHKQRLNAFIEKITASANDMLTAWARQHARGSIDVYREMNQLTLEVVGKTLLSADVKSDFDKVNDSLTKVLTAIKNRSRFMRLPIWVPLPAHLTIQRNKQILDDTIMEIINQRRNSPQAFDDLLTMLMEVEDADTAERMTDKQLLDEVLTIFIAGHETTANALAFTFYLLATHPEAKKKVDEEVSRLNFAEGVTFEQLQRLEYTTLVIKEAMRLYPPAWIVVREAATDDVIDGYLIKKGDKILASPYAMQRSPRFWKNPDEFNPERFRPENLKAVPKYAYFPFGGGARLCIGNNFAMMEMQLILALVCRQYNFTLPPNFQLQVSPLVTLRPKHDMPLVLSRKR